MDNKNKRFKVFAMLLGSLVSNCLCFSSKKYKNYDKNKINRVNYRKKKKRQLKVKYSKKNNIVKGAALLSTFALLGYLGKKCLGRCNDVVEETQGKVKLSKVDEEYIRRNFFLCAWENNSCWNDVFVQFFMCPDVRRGKYNSEAIMTTIDFINSVLGQEYNGDCLCRKVKCPINKRPIFKYLDEIKWHYADYHLKNSMFGCCALFESSFNGKTITSFCSFETTSCVNDNWDIPEDFSENTISPDSLFVGIDPGKTKERLGLSIEFERTKKWNSSNIFFENFGYYPTFVRIFRPNHFVSYYIIYNENKEVKYFLLADGMKKNMVVLSKEQALAQIGVSKDVNIVYTRGNIVEQYYIP